MLPVLKDGRLNLLFASPVPSELTPEQQVWLTVYVSVIRDDIYANPSDIATVADDARKAFNERFPTR